MGRIQTSTVGSFMNERKKWIQKKNEGNVEGVYGSVCICTFTGRGGRSGEEEEHQKRRIF